MPFGHTAHLLLLPLLLAAIAPCLAQVSPGGCCEDATCSTCEEISACQNLPGVSPETAFAGGLENCGLELPDMPCSTWWENNIAGVTNDAPVSSTNPGGCLTVCSDPDACNYASLADCDYTDCPGCTDSLACNFNPLAITDNGSCEYLTCAGVAVLYFEDFENYPDNYGWRAGILSGGYNGTETNWTFSGNIDALVDAEDYFMVDSVNGNKEFSGRDLGSEIVWVSKEINVMGYTDLSFSMTLRESSNSGLEQTDYIQVSYISSDGLEIQIASLSGDFDSIDLVQDDFVATTSLQFVVRQFNDGGSETYYFDNLVLQASSCPTGNADGDNLCDGADNCNDTSASNFAAEENEVCFYAVYEESFQDASLLADGDMCGSGTVTAANGNYFATCAFSDFIGVVSYAGSQQFTWEDSDNAGWQSPVISIAGYIVDFSAEIAEDTNIDVSDNLTLFISLDGGAYQQYDQRNRCSCSHAPFSATGLMGSTMQIMVFASNDQNENWYMDNVLVQGCVDQDSDGICDEADPCVNQPNGTCGCTDDAACNFNDGATQDDGSCTYPGMPCADPNGETSYVYAANANGICCECVTELMAQLYFEPFDDEIHQDETGTFLSICSDYVANEDNWTVSCSGVGGAFIFPSAQSGSDLAFNVYQTSDVILTTAVVDVSDYAFAFINAVVEPNSGSALGSSDGWTISVKEDGLDTPSLDGLFDDVATETTIGGIVDVTSVNQIQVVVEGNAADAGADIYLDDIQVQAFGKKGCTVEDANNFNPAATFNDGSCVITGCADVFACNYDADANSGGQCVYASECESCSGETDGTGAVLNGDSDDDGICDVEDNCTDPEAFNYLDIENTSCAFYGCTDGATPACNFDPLATDDDGSCEYLSCVGGVIGCTYPTACNFNASATADDGTCTFAATGLDCNGDCLLDADQDGTCDGNEIPGCTDPLAINHHPSATEDDGSCQYDGPDACPQDVNDDNVIGVADILEVLASFGASCN